MSQPCAWVMTSFFPEVELSEDEFSGWLMGEFDVPTVTVRQHCRGRACAGWPVCRSHVRSWANAHPLEAAKRCEPVDVRLRTGARWAEERGLGPGPWVELWIVPVGTSRVSVVVSRDDALLLADWYEAQGQHGAADQLRRASLPTAKGGSSEQVELFA